MTHKKAGYQPTRQGQDALSIRVYEGNSVHIHECDFLGTMEQPIRPDIPIHKQNVVITCSMTATGMLDVRTVDTVGGTEQKKLKIEVRSSMMDALEENDELRVEYELMRLKQEIEGLDVLITSITDDHLYQKLMQHPRLFNELTVERFGSMQELGVALDEFQESRDQECLKDMLQVLQNIVTYYHEGLDIEILSETEDDDDDDDDHDNDHANPKKRKQPDNSDNDDATGPPAKKRKLDTSTNSKEETD